MSVCAITGSASGIGAAIRRRLEKDGARVIGIDLRDAEIVADLGYAGRPRGGGGRRARALRGKTRSAGGRGGHRHARAAALARGLGELLRRGRRARRPLRGAAQGQRARGARRGLELRAAGARRRESLREGAARPRRARGAPARRRGRQLDPRLPRLEARARPRRAAARGRLEPRGRAHQRDRAGPRAHAAAPGRHGRSRDGRGGQELPACRSGAWPSPRRSRSWPPSCSGPAGSFIQGSIYYIDGGSDAQLRPDRF